MPRPLFNVDHVPGLAAGARADRGDWRSCVSGDPGGRRSAGCVGRTCRGVASQARACAGVRREGRGIVVGCSSHFGTGDGRAVGNRSRHPVGCAVRARHRRGAALGAGDVRPRHGGRHRAGPRGSADPPHLLRGVGAAGPEPGGMRRGGPADPATTGARAKGLQGRSPCRARLSGASGGARRRPRAAGAGVPRCAPGGDPDRRWPEVNARSRGRATGGRRCRGPPERGAHRRDTRSATALAVELR